MDNQKLLNSASTPKNAQSTQKRSKIKIVGDTGKNTSLRPSRIHFSIRKYTSIFVTFYVVKNVIKCQKARSYHS